MYEYIKGKITDINSTYITLENNNIGYAIYTGNPYYYQLDKEYKVYIYNRKHNNINFVDYCIFIFNKC